MHFLRRRGQSIAALLHSQREVLIRQEWSLVERRQIDDELGRMLVRWRWVLTDAALRFVDAMRVEDAAQGRSSSH